MKISGFTFLRNAITNGYPFEESIRSLLPLVDELICVVGESHDETRQRICAINDQKIKIVDTVWNDNMRDRGFVYGQQKMIGHYNCTGDWVFYLEGDEVLHEKDIETIRSQMISNNQNKNVEALYFDFLHFYGTPNQIGIAGYRQAPRAIKNTIRAIAPDGLFWVVLNRNKKGRYPKAISANATIYHYGHCRSVSKMNSKLQQVGQYWGHDHSEFSGYGLIDKYELRDFSGTHPAVMEQWLRTEAETKFLIDPAYRPRLRDYRNRLRFWIEEQFKVEISKKHFTPIDK